MTHDSKSSEVARLVRHLAELPGSAAVSILARRFARNSPAEHATYHETAISYPAGELPDELNLLENPDEIVITLRGQLPEAERCDELIRELERILDVDELRDDWESRAQMPGSGDYSLTLFTASVTPMELPA